MPNHTVTSFDDELKSVAGRVSEMGGLSEVMLTDAISSLIRMDKDLARRVIAQDKRVDALQFEVEEQAILIIARRQPVAQDLRDVIAAMHARSAAHIAALEFRKKSNIGVFESY